MLRLFRQLLLCVAPALGLYVFAATQVFGQAALLPNAKQTFLDGTGKPLAAGKVYFYVPGSTTKKTTWSDNEQTSNNTNPVILDAAGRAVIFGQGAYRQVVQNAAGVQQWDSYTNAYGSSAPSGSTGTDTAPVGSVMAYSGLSVPTNWQLAYGQALNRADYPDLLTAITVTNSTVSCTTGSTSLSGFSNATLLSVGSKVEASCIPTGTTIRSITSNTTIVVSNAAVSTGTVSATIFPWGNGDGVGTFNVPDLRGRVIAGPDGMGGSLANRLTVSTTISTTNGSTTATVASANGLFLGMAITSANIPYNATIAGINGTTVNLSAAATATASGTAVTFAPFVSANASASGGGFDATTIVQSNLPNVNFTNSGIAVTNGTFTPLAGISFSVNYSLPPSGGATSFVTSGTNQVPLSTTTSNVSVSSQGSAASGGLNIPITTIQPTVTLSYIIKVKPNSTGAGGVVSWGGLIGDIAVDSTLQAYTVGSTNYAGCTTATSSQIGCSKPDGVTIVATAGTLTAIAGVASSIDAAGATSITGGTSGRILYDNAGKVGEKTVTGTGSVVLDVGATLSVPILGTPNIVGHPTIEGVTSTGATGIGNIVFSQNPIFIGPTLGAAAATSINGLTITSTTGTLTVANGKTATDTSGAAGSILLGTSGGGFVGYAGATCTNQFVRALSNSGAGTCATVQNSDLANSSVTIGATSVALGGTLTAVTGRGPSGLNVESLHQTGDANVIIASSTRTEQTTTTLTAARTWTLPAANTLNPGQSLIVSDAAGAINGSNVINVTAAGADMINGSGAVAMSTQYQQLTLISDGTSKWTYNSASGGGGGGTVTAVSAGAGLSGGTITTSGTLAVLNSRNQVARFGSFDVWQRGTSLSVAASTTNAYQNDGWYILTNANQASTVSQQSGIATGSLYSARVQRNSGQTGTGVMRYAAPLDSDEISPLQGSYVALSFTVSAGSNWSPTSGTLNYYIFCGTGSPGKRSSTPYTGETNVFANSTNLTPGGAATRITATSAAVWPTNCTQAEIQFFWTPTGTASTNDYFNVDSLQLEPVSGSTGAASPFTPMSLQQQLSLAQRFFWQISSPGTLNGFGFGQAFSTTSAFFTIPFPVTMRVVPTGVTANSAGNFGTTNASGTPVTCSSIVFLNATTSGETIRCDVASGLVAGNASGLFATSASGTLQITGAEL